jgi:hypothetical protein
MPVALITFRIKKNLLGTQISSRHRATLCVLPEHAALARTLNASSQTHSTWKQLYLQNLAMCEGVCDPLRCQSLQS